MAELPPSRPAVAAGHFLRLHPDEKTHHLACGLLGYEPLVMPAYVRGFAPHMVSLPRTRARRGGLPQLRSLRP